MTDLPPEVTPDKKKELAKLLAQKVVTNALPVPQPRNEPEFTFGGHGVEKTVIGTQAALALAVEREIDERFGGLDLLFTKNDVATSRGDWAQLVYSYMEEAYELGNLNRDAVRVAVGDVKDKHRVQLLSNMANNKIYATTDVAPYSVQNLKEILEDAGAFLEPEDDEVLQKIFDGTVGQGDDYRAGWIKETGDISSLPAAKADLLTLVGQCSGNLHSAQIGTVVGGNAIKGGKKVSGLTYPSARIDRQNPPPGAFNVQFQVGNDSLACVIFDLSDPTEVVLEKLVESFDTGKQLRSPRVGS